MIEGADVEPIYEGSNGRYYTAWQVDHRLDTGEWRPCLHDLETGRRLVEADGDLVMLVARTVSDCPGWVRIRLDQAGPRVVDARRTVP
ncbi:hypothetical protein ACFOZ7_13930 [Natribaculum luteum]|uniref:Uncharacterized protein n=1 Tax=Natribaculum luteum TaxID=1586232 RepID=A0ABD5P163_9EURY|nr:hypothetical protein [Natribaculum luteum]